MANHVNANMRDVARLAGVSAGTVSRVLSNRMGRTQVSTLTRKRILDAVRELNYVPNINATRLFSQKTGVLGFIVPRIADPNNGIFTDQHLVRIFNGIERTIASEGYRILLISQDPAFVERKDYLTIFRSKQLDGVFIWGAHRDDNFYGELRANGFPHVFITTRPDCSDDESAFFRADYVAAGRNVMRHLLAKGYRRIVWCASVYPTTVGRELERGAAEALAECSLSWDKVVRPHPGGFFYNDGIAFGESLLRERDDADAILTVSHDSARGCFDYFLKRDIRPPRDYALACCDSLVEEPSVVKIPRSYADDVLLGRMAAVRLMGLVAGENTPARNLIPTVFVPGETA